MKNQFIYTVLKEIEDSDSYRVVPTSKDIIKFFRRHRQFKSLLPAGISLDIINQHLLYHLINILRLTSLIVLMDFYYKDTLLLHNFQ